MMRQDNFALYNKRKFHEITRQVVRSQFRYCERNCNVLRVALVVARRSLGTRARRLHQLHCTTLSLMVCFAHTTNLCYAVNSFDYHSLQQLNSAHFIGFA